MIQNPSESSAHAIRQAEKHDEKWVIELFRSEKARLGIVGPQVWWRWLSADHNREKWIVISQTAFAHYRIRRDGSKALYEIAVNRKCRRQGMGKALIEFIGPPLFLKTNAMNEQSNAFYAALGFVFIGTTNTKTGLIMNNYVLL